MPNRKSKNANQGSTKTQVVDAPLPETPDRIYFCTNVLIEAHWPRASTALLNLLNLAEQLHIPCVIPAPVSTEVEEVWLRTLSARLDALNGHLMDGLHEGVAPFTERQSAAAHHAAIVAEVLRARKVQEIPLSTTPLADIFLMAARHQYPFNLDDQFRDRLILLSILEDLRSRDAKCPIFLTRDKLFTKDEELRSFVVTSGLRICEHIQPLVDQLVEVLVERRANDQVEVWKADCKIAEDAALEKSTWPMIEAHLRQRIEEFIDPTIISVEAIDFALKSVQTPFPPEREIGDLVELTAEIDVRLRVIVRERISTRRMRGEIPNSTTMRQTWDRTVNVVLGAVYESEGYAIVDVLSVDLSAISEFELSNNDIIVRAGFTELPSRGLWISERRRMAFSDEALRDRSAQWLREALAEQVSTTDFVFHFGVVPADLTVCQDILKEIGLSRLTPNVRITSIRS